MTNVAKERESSKMCGWDGGHWSRSILSTHENGSRARWDSCKWGGEGGREDEDEENEEDEDEDMDEDEDEGEEEGTVR